MKIFIIYCILLFGLVSKAGTIDPNVSDNKYIEYGEQFNYVVGIQVHLENKEKDALPNFGSAVIINEKWAVTAAHVVLGYKECVIVKDKKDFIVNKVISHKDFKEENTGIADIALVKISGKFDLDYYPKLYDLNDEIGKEVSICGYGFVGKLQDRVREYKFDRKRRAGKNIIDNIYSDILICSAKKNDEDSQMEFVICAGDSGGGLFIDNKLAGINSCVLATDGHPDSSFTDESGHTRISKFREWIIEKINNE